VDINEIFAALNLDESSIDPHDLEYAIGSLKQSQRLNNMLKMQEARNLREEEIERANNPGLSSFYDALAQARVEGAQSVWRN
jgi:hypothetical protein